MEKYNPKPYAQMPRTMTFKKTITIPQDEDYADLRNQYHGFQKGGKP